LEWLERFNYRKATLVLGQSNEILNHVLKIVPDKKTFLYRNFPQFVMQEIINEGTPTNKLRIVYAGLLGVAQGIYALCNKLDYTNAELHLYGSGAETYKIVDFINKNPDLPIFYHGELKRENLHKELLKYDLTIIPLMKRIYGSVPSKIFEYSRLGLPILYFGGGEGEDIVNDHQLGWVAENRNYDALNEVLKKIDIADLTEELRSRIKEVAEKEFDFLSQLNELTHHL
ncbi:MAG: glycosyltransferase, partial [Bacteroidia bacterium]|nr:glycosyltransferase [Bacteroidia bacterium]